MAPPCGDAAAAASAAPDLTSLHICESSRLPPLPARGGGIVVEREENGDKNKKGKKEKAGSQRVTGWGLRKYSKIVSKKVEAKGRTTYNEVADEIFSELKSMTPIGQEFDEKNIRRRVYDAFNVLIAIRVIAKEKKEIKWMGLSNYRYEKIQKLEEVRKDLINKIKNKKILLQEIEKQTSRKTRVEIEISEDSKFARFEFNGTPFTLHDDVSILGGIRRNSIGRAGLCTLQ